MKKLLCALAFAAAMTLSAADAPKYIFYFIGDGMGHGHVMATETFNRLALNGERTLNMLQLPVASVATTYSASSPVTDSAAAGTALATGSKTRNSMLGMDADTIAVYSIGKHLHDMGYGVAILTTVAADDATPGAFYAHVPNRGKYADVTRQAAESDFELIGGAAFRGMKDSDGNYNELLDYFKANDVDVAFGTDALANTTSRRAILLPDNPVWDWNVGYTVDAFPGALTLPEMVTAGIDHLMRVSPERFFMMAEGGNIDHAGHANDGGAVIREVNRFDEAIGVALDFAAQHPDETLIVITADHETGGMSVGNQTTGYQAYTQYFIPQSYSKDNFSDLCDRAMTADVKPGWPEMRALLVDSFGFGDIVPISDEQWADLERIFNDTFIAGNARRQETLYANFNQFAVEVFDILNDVAGIGWSTLKHTGNPVPVFASGVGAELFSPVNDNTDIPKKILQIANGQ